MPRRGHRVKVVDNLWRGRLENLRDDESRAVIDLDRDFWLRDLTIPDAIKDLVNNVDYVVHLADIVGGIGYVFNNQGSVFRQNLLINSNVVASISRAPRLRGYMYVGTACSFPAHKQTGVDAPPLREEDLLPAAPESAYGWSKLMGQYEAELMQQEHRHSGRSADPAQRLRDTLRFQSRAESGHSGPGAAGHRIPRRAFHGVGVRPARPRLPPCG